VIIIGMGYCAWAAADLAGGAGRVIEVATGGDRLRFLPEADPRSILEWVTAGLVVALGSVPQQDVLQRVKSSRDERTAAASSILGGLTYFVIASVPIFLACAALAIDPAGVERLAASDPQLILPTLILERTPFGVQVLFFGALLSAILSTAGGALLAPAVTLAENVVRPLVKPKDDRALLATMRFTVLGLATAVLAMALTSRLSIYQLVNESGKVVLVTSFVPLAAGLFWPGATGRGALASIGCGLVGWLAAEALAPQAVIPPALAGFAASLGGMVAGSLALRDPRAAAQPVAK
jgi:Na+/proline symporter